MDRRARWLAVLAPFVVITVLYVLYRSAVMPAGSLSSRYGEGGNPLRSLVSGISNTIKGVPWEIRALPLLPLVAAFVLGFVLNPRSRAWRVVLLGLGGVISGVLPMTFVGSPEPRLLYVAHIGFAMAVAGMATVFAQAISGAGRRSNLARIAAGTVTALLVIAIGISHVESQNLYRPGSSFSLKYDLSTWVWDAAAKIPPENLAELERHLRDAGLLDEDGNLRPGLVDDNGNVVAQLD